MCRLRVTKTAHCSAYYESYCTVHTTWRTAFVAPTAVSIIWHMFHPVPFILPHQRLCCTLRSSYRLKHSLILFTLGITFDHPNRDIRNFNLGAWIDAPSPEFLKFYKDRPICCVERVGIRPPLNTPLHTPIKFYPYLPCYAFFEKCKSTFENSSFNWASE